MPGKFLPQKAKELGVKPGPLYGQLKAGTAVMGKDCMVQPEEVSFCLLLAIWCAALLSAMSSSPMLAPNVSGLIVFACLFLLCMLYMAYLPEVSLTLETWAAGFQQSHVSCYAVPANSQILLKATLRVGRLAGVGSSTCSSCSHHRRLPQPCPPACSTIFFCLGTLLPAPLLFL